ncbi:hypothetical protein BSK66_31820 [Paenibacillus odorifer]|uniref:MFS transporter n=1 Tax=Paenibacillus TaxID=44249 RepID=UPI0003E1EF3F|nr:MULTISPECIES: MFS transporter [Paenibacillus]ETT61025.1 hypothetical protein C171_13435 [Paenibacillus sp. FSL H8-237]OMD13699.1 hypothetical protein BJP47_24025 [Paenibacillus odorifer]OME46557.1 hypothetical protein BSK66_31820 [Paenibacillus odorifer]
MFKNHGELAPLLLINAILLIYFMVAYMLFRRWKTQKYLILVSTTGISFLVYAIFMLLRMFQDSALEDLRFMLAFLNLLEVFAMIVLMGSFHFLSPKNKKNFTQLVIVTGSLLLISTISIFMKGPMLSILFLLLSGAVFYGFFWFGILPLLTKKKYFFIAIGAHFLAMIFQMIYVLSHSPITIIGCFLFQAILFASMLLAFFDRILDLVQIALQQSATQSSSTLGQTKPEEEFHESSHYEPKTVVTEIPNEVEFAAQSSSTLSQIKPEDESQESNHPEFKTVATEIPYKVELATEPPAEPEVQIKNATHKEEEVRDPDPNTDSMLEEPGSVIANTKHPFPPKEATKLPKFSPDLSKPMKSKEDLPAKVEEEHTNSRQLYSEKTWFERIPQLNDDEKEELEKILEANYRTHYGDRNPIDTQKNSAIEVTEETSEVSEEKETKLPFLHEKETGKDKGVVINPFKKN